MGSGGVPGGGWPSGVTSIAPSVVFSIALQGRPTSSQGWCSTSYFWRMKSSPCQTKMLHASPYLAISRNVFSSPVPPIRIGGCGGWKRVGHVERFGQVEGLALERGDLATPHLERHLERFFQDLKAVLQRRIGHAQAACSFLVPAAPCPSRRAPPQYVQRGDSLDQDARVAIVTPVTSTPSLTRLVTAAR